MRVIALVLSVLAFGGVAAAQEHELARPEVGQALPDVRLPTVDGTSTVRLSDFRGRKLLLIEFASW